MLSKQLTDKQPPKLLLGQLHKSDQFLAGSHVVLALCCTLHPSSNPTRKSGGVQSGDCGGYSTDPLRPIHQSGKVLPR
jgi:hypothetical protein